MNLPLLRLGSGKTMKTVASPALRTPYYQLCVMLPQLGIALSS